MRRRGTHTDCWWPDLR